MSTIRTTYGDPALGGEALARDRARELLGPVMGFVAVAVAFAALGIFLDVFNIFLFWLNLLGGGTESPTT